MTAIRSAVISGAGDRPRRGRRLRWPLLVLLAFFGGNVFGAALALGAGEGGEADWAVAVEEILFEELGTVYSATKYAQKSSEAPASVSIITAQEIKRLGYRTIGEIIASQVGLYATYDRMYTSMGVRGFGLPGDYNTRILVLLNGHRINENLYYAFGTNMDGIIDVDLIDRVEIIRGPGSSLYGSNAFFAVVNLITRRGRSYQGIEMAGQAGSHETYKARATYGQRYDSGIDWLVSGNYFSSRGSGTLYYEAFDDPSTNNGIVEGGDGETAHSIFSGLAWGDFMLEGAHVKRDKEFPGAPYDTVFNDDRTQSREERGYLALKYEKQYSYDWGAMLRLSYDFYRYEGDYLYDYPPLTEQKDSGTGQSVGVESHITRRLAEKHHVIVGGELRRNFQLDQQTYDQEPFEQYLDRESTATNWGLFLQDQYTPWRDLSIYAGLRYDHYSSFGGAWSPRAAVVYQPWAATVLKLIYGRAFRAPNEYELYYDDGGAWMKSNPELEPETIDHYEALLEQSFNQFFRGSVSAYHYRIKNLIGEVEDPTDGLTYFSNIDQVKANGVEFNFDFYHPRYDLKARAGLNIQEAKDQTTDTDLVNSPTYVALFNLTAPVWRDRIHAGVTMNYIGKRNTITGGEVDDALITNLTLTGAKGLVAFLPKLELSASCYNLFDEQYSVPASAAFLQDRIPQDGRTFLFRASYAF